MNCRPGDLARIIDSPGTRLVGHVDRFIRVTESSLHAGMTVWSYEGPKLICRCGCGFAIASFGDEVLRPLRDPGDDAIDWISHRTPRSVDLREDQLTRARAQLLEATS